MALTEQTILDQVTIDEHNIIFYKYKTTIFRDEEEISSTVHRGSVVPGEDVSSLDTKIQTMANTFWTEQVIIDYQEYMDQLNSQNIPQE
jgi:hypothetical protein